MDEQSREALDKILQKLGELEQQVKSVGDRVSHLEQAQKDGDGPDALAAAKASEGDLDPRDTDLKPAVPAPPVREPEKPKAVRIEPPPLPQKAAMKPQPTEERQTVRARNEELAAARADTPVRAAGPPGAPPRRPAPKQKPAAAGGESLEMRIAGTWLPRAGVLVLALVLILFAREHVQGPVGKVVGSYLLSLALIVFGLLYAKKYPRWSSPVLAGGLAFSYFATYAMGFVEPMRLLENLGVKLALLAVNLAVIFAFAQWRKSEVMAGTALVLGYLTTGLVGHDAAALWSCVALSVVAVLFLWLNRWFVSTAVAAVCSYAAWLYVLRALPAPVRAPDETFWFNFGFLSLLFAVFVAAGWFGAGILRKLKRAASGAGYDLRASGEERILTTLAQTNVAAYIAAMVWLLRTTEVYWDRAWLFFFPMVAVSAGLCWAFRAVRPIRQVYLLSAAVCLAFGIMSAASPNWLPVFLAVQALAMLVGARQKDDARAWNGLSAILLLFVAGYTLTGQHPIWAEGSRHTNMGMAMPMWVCAVVAAITLAYAVIWETGETRRHRRETFNGTMPYVLAALAGFVWIAGGDTVQMTWRGMYLGAAIPVIAAAAVISRTAAPLAALIVVALGSLFTPTRFSQLRGDSVLWVAGNWLMLGAAFAAGLWLERTRDMPARAARYMWRIVYLWAQISIVRLIATHVEPRLALLSLALLFSGSIAAGWGLRSAALAKSATVVLVVLFEIFDRSRMRQMPWTTFAAPVLLMGAAYPIGLPRWQARTGDTSPRYAGWFQGLALAQAGLAAVYGLTGEPFLLNGVLVAGAWSLVVALFAVLGAFTAGVYVSVGFAGVAALILSASFLNDMVRAYGGHASQPGTALQPVWALVGIAFIVAAERVMRMSGRFVARRPGHPYLPWPKLEALRWITAWMAVGTLVMAVVALRLVPELRVFYFTGAMVAAAFVWIVLGFWFGESIYRRSGLVLLCLGLVKGLVWDVLSLKNTVYRQISWTVLGVLAIGASFLYNRFRSRVEERE